PYIREQSLSAESPLQAPFGSVRNPIRVMEIEHETAGSIMGQIRNLSQDYTAPADGCTTYNVLYALLKEFEENLHEHIHLENNILFPRSVEMSEVRGTK
nr:hemerythrin domain-containing protein [Haliscomenobacter sp.]